VKANGNNSGLKSSLFRAAFFLAAGCPPLMQNHFAMAA
jgi:hypothetical protein